MGNFLGTSDDTDLVESAYFGAQPTVNAENFAINDGAEDEEVEDLAAGFPDGCVAVLLLALFVETVNLGNLTGFVVSANEGDTVGVAVRRVSYTCNLMGRKHTEP